MELDLISKRKSLTGTRYLTFSLQDEIYCFDILKVKEILGMAKITPIPQTPDFIQGVIDLRGQIIPVIDLRRKFGMEEREYTKRTGVIVTELHFEGEQVYIGLVVDRIIEVVALPQDSIKKSNYLNRKIRSEYIDGIANIKEGIRIVIDPEKILNEDEMAALKDLKED